MESTLALNAIWCSVGSYVYGSIYIHHYYVVTKIADHIEKDRGHDRILVAIVFSNCNNNNNNFPQSGPALQGCTVNVPYL